MSSVRRRNRERGAPKDAGMGRTKRVVVARFPHHVWTRGNNRRRIFSRSSEYEHYLWLLARARDRYEVAIHGLCLMSNHVHLLVTPPVERALARFMKYVNQRYAQERNQQKDGTGKLFEQGFGSAPVGDGTYLAIVTMYIDANPTRAGMRQGFDYRWSIAPHHLGRPEHSAVPPTLWTPSAWYLSLGATAAARALAYRQLLAQYVEAPTLPAHVEERGLVDNVERLSAERYDLRLRRPDGTSAREPTSCQYRKERV